MTFFTQVLKKADGTFDRSTTGYDSIDIAEQAFHQGMVSCISKEQYIGCIMYVFDDDGVIKFRRTWNRA